MRGEAMEGTFSEEHLRIPGYVPVRFLGRNGGIVYLARRMSDGKEVILKVAREQYYTEHLRKHDSLLLHLDHPNILRVFEIGEVKGRTYAIEEYVEANLEDRLREGPLVARDSAILAQTLFLAIEYARDHGMVALRMTPSSILLTRDNVPKLFDFELRDEVGNMDFNERFVTRPAFMVPEDLVGEISTTEAADIYRIGAVMYAMLTGSAPFSGNAVEISKAVLHRPPEFLRKLNPAVPINLEAICLRCLEKQVERRYGSLGYLADELGRFVDSC